MNGIDNIIKAISDEAEARAQQIIDEANEQAREIIDRAKQTAIADAERLQQSAKAKIAAIGDSAESFAVQDRKSAVLRAKTALISEVFDRAVSQLVSLPEDEYFTVINRLIAENAATGDCVLLLNSKDKARMPRGFMSLAASSVGARGTIRLSDEADDRIIGGCILQYGDIEINLGFDRIIAAEKEALTDKVNAVLFG